MQTTEPFFGFAPYHVALVAVGAGIILAFWIPRFFSGREPASSALIIVGGVFIYTVLPGMPAAIDPRTAPTVWEYVSELAVIVALFACDVISLISSSRSRTGPIPSPRPKRVTVWTSRRPPVWTLRVHQ